MSNECNAEGCEKSVTNELNLDKFPRLHEFPTPTFYCKEHTETIERLLNLLAAQGFAIVSAPQDLINFGKLMRYKYRMLFEIVAQQIQINTKVQVSIGEIRLTEVSSIEVYVSWRYPEWGYKFGTVINYTYEYLIDRADKVQYDVLNQVYGTIMTTLLDNTVFRVSDS
jgi:hypothetical protein